MHFLADIIQYITTVALAGTKFFAGMMVLLLRPIGFIPSIAIAIGGGVVGVYLFTHFGAAIKEWFARVLPAKNPKRFSSKNRFLVKLRRAFGVEGIAALTPVLLSIPLGVFLALTLTKNKKRIMISMAVSCVFWACVILIPYYAFNVNILSFVAK